MCLQTVRPTLWVAPYKTGLAGKVALLEGGWMGSLKRDKTVWVRGEMPSLARFFFRSAMCNALPIPFGSTLTTDFHHKSKNEIKANLPHDASWWVHATERIPQRQRHGPLCCKGTNNANGHCVAGFQAGRVESPTQPFLTREASAP